MAKTELKLLKPKKRYPKRSPTVRRQTELALYDTRSSKISNKTIRSLPDLTPAERAEAARFKALTMERAARQARLRRLKNKLGQLDHQAPSAA